jgi:hypothetical protein
MKKLVVSFLTLPFIATYSEAYLWRSENYYGRRSL